MKKDQRETPANSSERIESPRAPERCPYCHTAYVDGSTDSCPKAPALKACKVVRSKDVMETLGNLFDRLKGKGWSASDIGIYTYQALSAVPEFYATESDLRPTCNTPERDAESVQDGVKEGLSSSPLNS